MPEREAPRRDLEIETGVVALPAGRGGRGEAVRERQGGGERFGGEEGDNRGGHAAFISARGGAEQAGIASTA